MARTQREADRNIDMDKTCDLCGQHGVVEGSKHDQIGVIGNGKCLECLARFQEHFKGRSIGFETLTRAKVELCALIDEEAKKIDQAYVKADGEVTVTLTLKMAGTKMVGKVEVVATINFVDSRTKRSVKFVVEEKQMELPGV